MLEELLNPTGYFFWILIIMVISVAVAILSRPFSTYIKFVYPNAKYETMGNPYVSEKNLQNIAESKSLNDFRDALSASKDINIKGKSSYEIQRSLDESYIKVIDMMKKDSSKKMQGFFNTYLEKNDMFFIKKELRNKLKNNRIDEKSIEQAAMSSTKKLLFDMKDADKKNLKKILLDFGFHEDITKELENQQIDYMEIDNELDRYIINKILKEKVPYKCNQGKEHFIKTYLDIYNIKNILRCKQIGFNKEDCMKYFNGEGREIAKWKYEELSALEGVAQIINHLNGTSYYSILKDSIEEYNYEKTVQVLENKLDSIFLKIIKDISIKNYSTIGPSLRFLVFKEYEIQNLKVIAKAVAEGISKDITKKYLIMEAKS